MIDMLRPAVAEERLEKGIVQDAAVERVLEPV